MPPSSPHRPVAVCVELSPHQSRRFVTLTSKNTLKSITNIPATPPSVIVQSHYFLFWTIMFRYFETYYVYWDLKSPSIQYCIPFQNSCRLSRSLFVTSCNRAHNSRIYVCFFWGGFAKWNNSSNKMIRLSTFQLPTDMSQLSTLNKFGDCDFTMWIRVVCVW